MSARREHWLTLEREFDALGKTPSDFYVTWSSSREVDSSGKRLLPSHWTWWGWPTEEHRLKFMALAKEAALLVSGGANEDVWLEEIRRRKINLKEAGRGMFHFPTPPWKPIEAQAWATIRVEYRGWRIERLFESSAALARLFAAEEIEETGAMGAQAQSTLLIERAPNAANGGLGSGNSDRESPMLPQNNRQRVDAFLESVKKTTKLARPTRTMIWRLAGHSTARQFERWQADNDEATASDHKNFNRILNLSPAEFEKQARDKSIID